MRESKFESGDKVFINCPGVFHGLVGKVAGKVISTDDRYRNSYYVDLNYDTPEPLTEIFAAEFLELVVDVEPKEEMEALIKDSGKRTEKPQENNGVNIWIKNAFGMGTIIIEAIGEDVHLFMENQKQDCTIVGQI